MTSTSAMPSPASSEAPLPLPPEYVAASWLREVYMWVLLAVGLPCNAACLLTVLSMHVTTATFYLALLALADSVALIVKAIYHQLGTFNAASCYMNYVNNWCSCYANWVLVLIMFQRFYAVCFPLRIRTTFTKTKIYLSAALLALLMFLVVLLPTFFMLQWHADTGNCFWREQVQHFAEHVFVPVILTALYFYLPFVSMVVLTTLIIAGLYRHRRQRTTISTSISGGSDGRAERAISIMLVCAGLIFLVLTLPACLFHIHISSLYDRSVRQELAQWYLFYQVVTMLSDANHAVNFFIYFASTGKFRHAFFRLVCHCSCFHPVRPGRSDSSDVTQEMTRASRANSLKDVMVASDDTTV